jgi:hypothetical protein
MLFHITTNVDNPYHPGLRLPQSFKAFLDLSQAGKWRAMFCRAFEARCLRLDGNERSLPSLVDGQAALSNVFYLLQALAPGMVVIVHKEIDEDEFDEFDAFDDYPEIQETTRILPPKEWIEAHRDVLEHVLDGGKKAYEDVLAAASNVS